MAKGGFPGMGNMSSLMKQAQKFQQQMEEMQKDLVNKTIRSFCWWWCSNCNS